jgi:hypothetical protein
MPLFVFAELNYGFVCNYSFNSWRGHGYPGHSGKVQKTFSYRYHFALKTPESNISMPLSVFAELNYGFVCNYSFNSWRGHGYPGHLGKVQKTFSHRYNFDLKTSETNISMPLFVFSDLYYGFLWNYSCNPTRGHGYPGHSCKV